MHTQFNLLPDEPSILEALVTFDEAVATGGAWAGAAEAVGSSGDASSIDTHFQPWSIHKLTQTQVEAGTTHGSEEVRIPNERHPRTAFMHSNFGN